jgi:hypothetical protein
LIVSVSAFSKSPQRIGYAMVSVSATVRALKANDEDGEWYPSTDEIILKVVCDMCIVLDEFHYSRNEMKSVMDIGAGDGRVLKAIQKGMKERNPHSPLMECYAIEKAMFHLSNMPKDITVVGTDFEQQALADKPVGAIFCNPPYSEFAEWTLKILREGSTRWVYLVIPRRWRENVDIKRAIEARSGEVTSLGEFDFLSADRKANAFVEIIRIEFSHKHDDAFNRVIEEMMPELDVFNVELEEEAASTVNREVFQAGTNLVEVLVDSYDRDLMSMLENYKSALTINVRILKELGVSKAGMLKAIRQKISGLKHEYWKTLFDEMGTIKTRLATKQRKAFLQSLRDKVVIDFTANNVYSMLIWVSKWANDFFDEQLIELFRTLSNDSNVVKYKSNQRIWVQSGWRYGKRSNFSGDGPEQATHYKLEYRMVLSHGGISNSSWQWDRDAKKGLTDSAFDLLNDLVTVANNLGFPCSDHPRNYEWKSNKKNVLKLNDGKPLVAVRAFQNGNMHLHFNQKFMLAINVEAGRLLKWIRNPAEAVEEMQVTGDEAKQVEAFLGQVQPGQCESQAAIDKRLGKLADQLQGGASGR